MQRENSERRRKGCVLVASFTGFPTESLGKWCLLHVIKLFLVTQYVCHWLLVGSLRVHTACSMLRAKMQTLYAACGCMAQQHMLTAASLWSIKSSFVQKLVVL